MARSKKEVEAIMAGLGVGVSVWDTLLKKGRDKCLDGEDFYFLATPEGEEALDEFIEVVLRNQSPRFATPFTDAKALDRWGSEIHGFKDMVRGHRAITEEVLGLQTDVKIVREVPRGFTIWHAPKFGPCYKDFEYMKDWGVPEEKTSHSLAFIAPRLVPDSFNENVEEQLERLAELDRKYGLPKHHLANFGPAPLLTNIILSHYNHSNERIPLNRNWTRTDTCLSSGYRLSLGRFDSDGLYCGSWRWGAEPGSYLGCFALGVEELG